MSVIVNGREFRTLSDEIFVNQKKVYEVWANGIQVYPDNVFYNGIIVTLTWSVDPRDLDSHVEGIKPDGSSFHVYYGHKSESYDDDVICDLDVDDTSSYGPEHTRIMYATTYPYYFYVHIYSGNGSFATSDAYVEVSDLNYQDNVVFTYRLGNDAPTNKRYWNVFKYHNGEIILPDEDHRFSGEPNTSY